MQHETCLENVGEQTKTILEKEGLRAPDIERLAERYELSRVLGRGGMGVVFVASDTKLQRQVAIKIGGKNSDASRQEIEVRTMASLSVDGIVSVFDFEKLSDGRAAIVMELIDGHDLQMEKIENRLRWW